MGAAPTYDHAPRRPPPKEDRRWFGPLRYPVALLVLCLLYASSSLTITVGLELAWIIGWVWLAVAGWKVWRSLKKTPGDG